jgi:hypothetical protein
MRDQEGSELVTEPAKTYRSCWKCKYYDHHLVKSGMHPIYASSCRHPDIDRTKALYSFEGNLPNKDKTPDWCPYLKAKKEEKAMKPVIKEDSVKAYISDYDIIKFISENAPMDWNKCCDFVRKHGITGDNGEPVYWYRSILKNPKDYDPEAIKWIGAFYEAHPFIDKMMIVFDD